MARIIPAAVSYDIRRTEVRELAFPEIPPDGGLLRVELTGVCGRDWPYYLNYSKSKGPLILGMRWSDTLPSSARRRRPASVSRKATASPLAHFWFCRL